LPCFCDYNSLYFLVFLSFFHFSTVIYLPNSFFEQLQRIPLINSPALCKPRVQHRDPDVHPFSEPVLSNSITSSFSEIRFNIAIPQSQASNWVPQAKSSLAGRLRQGSNWYWVLRCNFSVTSPLDCAVQDTVSLCHTNAQSHCFGMRGSGGQLSKSTTSSVSLCSSYLFESHYKCHLSVLCL
jgi:hypothetical protein